jgi:hypothetical protein
MKNIVLRVRPCILREQEEQDVYGRPENVNK